MHRKRLPLIFYDIAILLLVIPLQMYLYSNGMTAEERTLHGAFFAASLLCVRYFCGIYQQVWRYGGVQCYIRLVFSDTVAFVVAFLVDHLCSHLLGIRHAPFASYWFLTSVNLLFALTMRLIYRYVYKGAMENSRRGQFRRFLLRIFTGEEMSRPDSLSDAPRKIRIAIVGAGRVGVSLAEELSVNVTAVYEPVCFLDTDRQKAGHEIHGLPVFYPNDDVHASLSRLEVQEIILAMPGISEAKRRELYMRYTELGYKVRVYDYPLMQTAERKRQLRDLDIEELLFRKPIAVCDEASTAFYRDKVILITGGGGSIGSELCRQLAAMTPKQIIVLDIYENTSYDLQQELRMKYGTDLDFHVEICSITNKEAVRRVFEK